MQSLFNSFSGTSLEEWKQKLQKDLKGRRFEDLISVDANGISTAPFYTHENARPLHATVFSNPDWRICATVEVGDSSKKANEDALKALSLGASGLIFLLDGRFDFDYKSLLKDIGLEYIHSSFIVKNDPNTFTKGFKKYLTEATLEPTDCHIEYNPIIIGMQGGTTETFSPAAYTTFLQEGMGLAALSVDMSILQNAGANSVTQLSTMLAQLNEYLHAIEKSGWDKEIKRIVVKVSNSTNLFEEIAKTRAVRILVANVCDAYNIDAKLFIAAETSNIYRCLADKYNNILRDNSSAISAILGGCDSLSIHSFDPTENSDSSNFTRRISINQQLIFKEESYLNKVADVSKGSYYIDTLTKEMADLAWLKFQAIEQEGGILSIIDKGKLAAEVQKQRDQLLAEYRNGEKTLVGVNKYVNEKEPQPELRGGLSEGKAAGQIQPLNIESALKTIS